MEKKNKEMFKGEGGKIGDFSISSALNTNHEIKIAILLWFFLPELYLRIISSKSRSNIEIFAFTHYIGIIEALYDLLITSINKGTSIKFSDLKNIENFHLKYFIKDLLKELNELRGLDINTDTIAKEFIDKCKSLTFRGSVYPNINSYHTYVFKFLTSMDTEREKYIIEKVKEVINALIKEGKSGFDEYQLNNGNQFTIDITRMCESKLDLLTDINKLLTHWRDVCNEKISPWGESGGKKSKKLHKKEILGKTKSIHKIPGDRKEYVKHKGKLITVKSYKELIKKNK